MIERMGRPLPADPVEIPTPGDQSERLKLARDLYREFYSQCFWHCPEELDLTDDHIPMVVEGLRTYGGRRGFVLSGKLRAPLECR